MPDYRKMYFELAARVADAVDLLTIAQQVSEARYTEDPEPALHIEHNPMPKGTEPKEKTGDE